MGYHPGLATLVAPVFADKPAAAVVAVVGVAVDNPVEMAGVAVVADTPAAGVVIAGRYFDCHYTPLGCPGHRCHRSQNESG